jgi:hypothetical protein
VRWLCCVCCWQCLLLLLLLQGWLLSLLHLQSLLLSQRVLQLRCWLSLQVQQHSKK